MGLDVVILGPPGAGKGTQARRIAADAGIPHVATGDIFRAAIADGSEVGKRVRELVEAGELVPDELTVELVRERLARDDAARGFVVDGFPRTLAQAEAFDRFLAELGRELSVVLHFQLPEEVAERRLLGRAREDGRADDTPEVIRHRMAVQRVPEALTEYYRTKGLLVGVPAVGTVDEVYDEVQSVLEAAAR